MGLASMFGERGARRVGQSVMGRIRVSEMQV
jgi:hypothetical protein